MENNKQSIIARLKQAKNVLVTVSANPSVDQLAAAIATTIAINKAGMKANAVFSGQAPSTIDFLKPDETLEKNTDALRDFIISLDKAKADKLRYKVEDNHVKIFITPYKSNLTQEDLEFSQGDFNVDVVLALGVKDKQHLDAAITAQGRILHDATIIDISTDPQAALGTLVWTNKSASSLCEMTLQLVSAMKADILDEQIATAFLTGIVAETERFSNAKTTSEAMQASGVLMSAGANQQLIASKLHQPPAETPQPQPSAELPEPQQEKDGTLSIRRNETPPPASPSKTPNTTEKEADNPQAAPAPHAPAAPDQQQTEVPAPKDEDGALDISHPEGEETSGTTTTAEDEQDEEEKVAQIHIDEHGQFYPEGKPAEEKPAAQPQAAAPSQSENRGMALTPPTLGGELTANSKKDESPAPVSVLGDGKKQPPILHRDTPKTAGSKTDDTLAGLEKAVDSPHVRQQQGQAPPSMPSVKDVMSDNQSGQGVAPAPQQPPNQQDADPNAPPAVPPPMMPPFDPPQNQ